MNNVKFQFVGNNQALDFINTVIGKDAEEIDLLETPEALALWLKAAGYGVKATISAQSYKKALALREAIRTLMAEQSYINLKDLDDARRVLNEWLKHIQSHKALVYSEGKFEFETSEAPHSADYFLSQIAQAAASLLVETPPGRIRQCANPSCVLTFKDTSKSGRRKWCSMEICGNRAKVATHYKKHAV